MIQDNVNPLALALLIGACVVMLLCHRQRAVNAVMMTALFIPLGQQFMFAGLHVRFLPILIVVGLIRIIFRSELVRIQLTTLDKIFFAWCFISLAFTCLRKPGAECFGDCLNAVGAYLVFRSLTTETDDIMAALRFLALVGIGIGAVMLYERATGRNPFFVLGGVPEFDDIREGRIRCQGAFRHPLMAGAFGATLLPLMIGLWLNGTKDRRRAALGIVGSLVITVTAVSSGSLLTLMAGMVGMALWRIRDRMYLFRRGLVAAVILLQLVMKAPFWYIIARISDVLGGSGWHRSYLIDQFVSHFNEWWLIGTSYTAHWGPGGQVIAGNPDMMDITNHYIAQALEGGLLGLVLFISLLVSCFKIAGRLVGAGGCGTLNAKNVWMLGVAFGAHCAAFISVWYFDQITTYWTWLVAGFSSLAVMHARLQAGTPASEDEAVPVEKANSWMEEETARS